MPELGIEAGETFGCDLGVLYKPYSFLNVAAAVFNIGPEIYYQSSGESDQLPRMLRLGLAFSPVQTDSFGAMASLPE